jgi:hypothetical protein
MEIFDIIEAIRGGRLRISEHADDEAQEDELTFEEIYTSVFQGQIIESYPDDTPYPSCLVYGPTFQGDPIHTVWGYNPENKWVVLVTVYRPDPEKWVGWVERRTKR